MALARNPQQKVRRSLAGLSRYPAAGVVPLFGSAILMGAARTAIWTFGVDILREELQFSHQRIGLAWLVLGVTALVGVAAGAGTDRFGIAVIHRLSLVLMGLGIASLATGLSASVLPFVAMGVFGAGYITWSGT
ncbi:hypothetical protein E4L95_00295 [Paracoccus liaowanqingii]|uniref:MFS transporter n=1 Tax=Paracoccus liaowanqingii TaxID=2560053 RepID=A0A4Z1CTW5_9RHOB|nr:hypothetical protein [Paracoccus liaowanqingii]TGN68767.1 hypothetical protein E4L95_00295 [Paracoccus liaowanqingii]